VKKLADGSRRLKPDFAAGIYPGYRTATPVPEDAPPLFLAIADDDILVGPVSTAQLYEAWHKAGKPVELHIFASGAHEFGMKQQQLPSDRWSELFSHWLAAQGYFGPARAILNTALRTNGKDK
jgi:acetyl esterase/lipase